MSGVAMLEDGLKRLKALVSLLRANRKIDRAAALASRVSFLEAQKRGGSKLPRVWPNSLVTIKNLDSGEVYEYKLVFPNEANGSQGYISLLTPLGMSLIGREKGESFAYNSPGGLMRIMLLDLDDEDF
ncbi:MAG: GreA/GreB family elongation factor [Spirochaetia bacterium]|jgi:transcription elongation GreA/GreB family factor|nr:GreA/GreB family elongation factor [Spirochaetia bacterium]